MRVLEPNWMIIMNLMPSLHSHFYSKDSSCSHDVEAPRSMCEEFSLYLLLLDRFSHSC